MVRKIKPKGAIEEIESEYQKKPKMFWASLIILMMFILIIQSYIAEPRPINETLKDTWEIILMFLPISYIFLSGKKTNLLIIGTSFLALSLLMLFGFLKFINPAYGTLFFLEAIWLIGDWINIKVFKKSIFSELSKGNYYIAIGIILSTMIMGSIVELVNIPFKIWWYQWPFPSLELFGLPIFTIIFGWLPWILSMFVIFYPFATKKPKNFK